MGAWNFASKPEDDRTCDLVLNLNENDADGSVSGLAVFHGTQFSVKGQWAAKGSVAGRNASVFWFGGSSAEDAPTFLVAAGDLNMSVSPMVMEIAVTTASAGDGNDYGYNGLLTQIVPDE